MTTLKDIHPLPFKRLCPPDYPAKVWQFQHAVVVSKLNSYDMWGDWPQEPQRRSLVIACILYLIFGLASFFHLQENRHQLFDIVGWMKISWQRSVLLLVLLVATAGGFVALTYWLLWRVTDVSGLFDEEPIFHRESEAEELAVITELGPMPMELQEEEQRRQLRLHSHPRAAELIGQERREGRRIYSLPFVRDRAALEDVAQAYLKALGHLRCQPTEREQCILYALQQQAFHGDNDQPRPWLASIERAMRWQGWRQLQGRERPWAQRKLVLFGKRLIAVYGLLKSAPLSYTEKEIALDL
jgi:acyl-CoA-binding protein